ncbi:DNA replication ATP-dependent helicase/nuclease DNA2 [Candida viswanathii]|uniref:DNA replication ATP-dependent helicase/nuclease DNA2 n=1 Tax=Candida viswanathii TaxID=5486 RepID=A0A367XX34_9ASCO|nr:DNA replication ATP-dependent helicase/nuclease DNA2 [Candida viswanathii]
MSKVRSQEKVPANPKRAKDANEQILPVKRLKKVAYFPINNLTEPIQKKPNQNSPIRPLDPNALQSRVLPVVEVKKKTSSEQSQSPKKQELSFLQENSDDSFDGIRWKESPDSQHESRVQRDKSQSNRLPSSPLKNICPTADAERVDDRTADVLNKYGAIFNNSSMLPAAGLSKSCSDIGATNVYHDIPQARRAKSGEDFRTKKKATATTDLFQTTLNSWISKLEGDPEDAALNKILPTVKGDPVVGSILSSDDPFSDDENLVEVLQKQDQIKFDAAFQENLKKVDAQTKDSDDSESDDPFSDDDDTELMEILTMPEPTSASAKFGKSFQRGIKNIEKLRTERKPVAGDGEKVLELVYDRSVMRRYKIASVRDDTSEGSSRQLILHVLDSKEKPSEIYVRGDYYELDFQENDIVHLITTDQSLSKRNVVDDTTNLLIWNPDELISATTVSQQLGCPRKSIIKSRYKFPGVLTLPIIVGEIVHFIFQECICCEEWSYEFMEKVLEELLKEYRLAIFSIDKDEDDVREEVCKHFNYLKEWFTSYYKATEANAGCIEELLERGPVKFSVKEALDIEEEVKSPMFGIKGKIDATVTAWFDGNGTKGTFLMPMEIKTGKSYMYHNVQATLYALLFQDRYDFLINSYLLVYTKEKFTQKCNIRVSDLRSLIILRNKLSQYIKDNVTLPPLVKNSLCDICDVKLACMTLDNMVDDGTKENCGISEEEYEDITRGIYQNSVYSEYFTFWDSLIAQEENVLRATVKDLWTVPGDEGQRRGKCFFGMKITEADDGGTNNYLYAGSHGDKSNSVQFRYTFKKADDGDTYDLLRSQLNVGDTVIISDEAGQFAITSGTVKLLSRTSITVSTRRRILTSDNKLKAYNSNNQVFRSVLRRTQDGTQTTSEKTFRIDKDDLFYGLQLARYNVLNLFLPGGATKLRKLVVDYRKPTYTSHPQWEIPNREHFNSDQIAAMEKVFCTNDYALILGMPGTGKTTVIAEIIKIFVAHGKSVLLTSYTNSAVDNILLKLKELKVDFLRIDVMNRIETREQYDRTYLSPKVVATTCLGISDVCFQIRDKFDICIVDEASQISLPVNLGPLRFAERFVMVGDHNQLPPLVTNPDPEARQAMQQTLFMKLSDKHPESMLELTYQYRMCQDIMELSNVLIYNQKLKCGSEKVANRSLIIPNPHILPGLQRDGALAAESQWMGHIFDPANKVLFFDHDKLPAYEQPPRDAVKNEKEAKLVEQIVGALVAAGVEEAQIGVMSLYRAQVNLLKRKLSLRKNIEILTADQFQGRDKECVIISLVRSNEDKNPGDLLKDWRRLNVAITRAKSKLIILGSRSTLSSTDTTKTFIDFLENKHWYYEFPEGAEMMYDIPDQGALSSPVKQRRTGTNAPILNSHPVLRDVVQDISG